MQCSVFIAASLDGFIARLDGRIDWLSVVDRPREDYGYRAFHDSFDVLIVGRKTYEMALSYDSWPYAGKRCIVLTHGAFEAKHGEEFYSGSPRALVAYLSAEDAKRAYVDGGAVIQQFLTDGLINDMTVSIIPVLLGEGIPLFGNTGRDVPLKLVANRAFQSGLVQLEYRLPEQTDS